MKISDGVLKILANCEIRDNVLYLPPDRLERKTYEAVNKCLADIGGKWNRKAKGHVFDHDPSEEFDNLILTGETKDMKKEFQFFPTPREIAERLCDLAELSSESKVLEPSCGDGALADAVFARGVASLTGIEINGDMRRYLDFKPYEVIFGDFLALTDDRREETEYDRIVMNPPFSKQRDVDHITRAYEILRPGGVLVAVCSPSPFFRNNAKSVAFASFLSEVGAEVLDVPEGAFKASGTNIRTKIVKIRKGE
jgi:predicted RNA methylase